MQEEDDTVKNKADDPVKVEIVESSLRWILPIFTSICTVITVIIALVAVCQTNSTIKRLDKSDRPVFGAFVNVDSIRVTKGYFNVNIENFGKRPAKNLTWSIALVTKETIETDEAGAAGFISIGYRYELIKHKALLGLPKIRYIVISLKYCDFVTDDNFIQTLTLQSIDQPNAYGQYFIGLKKSEEDSLFKDPRLADIVRF